MKKREFLVYYILNKLAKHYNNGCIPLGVAIRLVEIITSSRKVARNLLKFLRRKRLIKYNNESYCISDINEWLDNLLYLYFSQRLRRRGYSIYYSEEDRIVEVFECSFSDKDLLLLEKAGIKLRCASSE